MIIGACGFGATGSSLVTDLLSEFDELQHFGDFEFSFVYKADGVEDLEYHLVKQFSRSISGDTAIKRFLYSSKYIYTPLIHKPTDARIFMNIANKYVDALLQTKFKGMESIDVISGNIPRNIIALGMKKIILPKTIERVLKRPTYGWPNRDVYISIKPENFYDASKEYIRDILKAMGADLRKPIVLDQPFEANSPEQSFKFFDDPYAIVVDRDPRDLYLEAKYRGIAEYRFVPRNDINSFCEYYRRIRTGRPQKDTDRILNVQFEDLIYEYEINVKRIINFLGLGVHVRKRKSFNPDRSVNNTQLIRMYPKEKSAIKYIEEQLTEFLYPFEKYKDVKTDGKALIGSSRYKGYR